MITPLKRNALPWPGRVIHSAVEGVWKSFYRLEVEGVEHIPASGTAILCSNHPSYLDPLTIYIASPRPITFFAWEKPFAVPVVGWAMRLAGSIPVNTQSPTGAHQALRKSLEVLQNGRLLGIFPEGGRSVGRRLLPLKSGAAQLAIQTGAPVVPATIRGALSIWPRERAIPRPIGRIQVIFHPPIAPPRVHGADKKAAAAELNRQIRHAICSRLDYPCLENNWPQRPALAASLRKYGYAPIESTDGMK